VLLVITFTAIVLRLMIKPLTRNNDETSLSMTECTVPETYCASCPTGAGRVLYYGNIAMAGLTVYG
jgi:hypothetical protein